MVRLNLTEVENIKIKIESLDYCQDDIYDICDTIEVQQQEIDKLNLKIEKAKILLKEYEICSCCVNDSMLKIEELPKDHPCIFCRVSNINGLNWKFNEELLKP
jgi:hypothetical protein